MSASLNQFRDYALSLVKMDEDIFQLVKPYLRKQRLQKGENFIVQGKICKEIAFINSGLVKIFYLKDGIEVNTCFCQENSIASSFESYTNATPSSETIQALEDTELLVFSKENLEELFQANSDWKELAQKMISFECVRLSNRVQALGFESGLEKYKNLISTQPEIIQRVPIQDIASYLGVSRETLSRIRSKISR